MDRVDYLIDTNIISELAKKNPDTGVIKWASSIRRCAVSVITLEEIFYGLSWKPNNRIQHWFHSFINDYADIIEIDTDISRVCGLMRGNFQAKGIVRTQADMLIAASAVSRGLVLVTRNLKDFEGCSVSLLNPFSQ